MGQTASSGREVQNLPRPWEDAVAMQPSTHSSNPPPPSRLLWHGKHTPTHQITAAAATHTTANPQLTIMARRLIPLLDRVLVEKIVAPTKSAGGVLLPESAAPKVNEGVVLAVGPGRRTKDGELIPTSVKEGDKVLLPEYGGSLVKMDNKEMFLFRDEDLLGILTE